MRIKNISLFTVVILCVGVFVGCRTSEKNYREAYEKATAENNRGVTDFKSTIYSRHRNNVTESYARLGSKTIPTKIFQTKVTEDGGGVREWLKRYSVVVAEFKQKFNANSVRTRFADAGYTRAFIVENAEPYYYVLADSSDDLAVIDALADSIRANSPVPLKDGFPYILQRP